MENPKCWHSRKAQLKVTSPRVILHAILSRSISERINSGLAGQNRCRIQIPCRSSSRAGGALLASNSSWSTVNIQKYKDKYTHKHTHAEHIEHQMASRAAAKFCSALACVLRREADDTERESEEASRKQRLSARFFRKIENKEVGKTRMVKSQAASRF